MKWEDPPTSRHGANISETVNRDAIAMELRANPGRWALVDTDLDYHGFNSLSRGLRIRGMTVSVRRQVDETYHLYARFEPPEGDVEIR